MKQQGYSLPSEGFVRIDDVFKVFPVGRTKWYEGIKNGEYPKPKKIGRKSVWNVTDIRELISKQNNT